MKYIIFLFVAIGIIRSAYAQKSESFDGLHMNLGNLYRLSDAKTRSISPENFTGEPGKGGMTLPEKGSAGHEARELGQGWKVNPFIVIEPGQTFTLAEINGSGAIQHIWMTPTGNWRYSVLRFYWDDEKEPSIEVPVGDFFGMGWGEFATLNSLAVTVNPGSAFNCYWVMPFRKKCNRKDAPVLPDRLYTNRCSCGCRVLSCTIQKEQSYERIDLYSSGWYQRQRTVCWYVYSVGCK
jgi:hypothetical protein